MSRGAAVPEPLEHQGQLLQGNAHAPHDVHDLLVFRLPVLLLQLFQPGLLFADFVPMHGFDQSITITLPPLSAVYFEVPAPRATRAKTAKAAADKVETKTAARKPAAKKTAAGEKKTATRRTAKAKVEKGAPAKETKAEKAEKAEKKAPAKRGRKPKAEKPAEE